MRKAHSSNNGFSLTEVLLAIGIITVGMLFIAGVFPVGIHFTTIASERTISAVVADEAFAKIRIYATGNPFDANDDIALGLLGIGQLTNYGPPIVNINPIEFAYPSEPNMDISRKQYYWSALCRRVHPDPNNRLVQVTVFVGRKTSPYLKYPGPPDGSGVPVDWPIPLQVGILSVPGLDTLQIDQPAYINDGYTIVDNQTGQIYRVLERDPVMPDRIILDRFWQGGPTGSVWVVPPPIGGGRCPFIAIYQRVIRF